MLPSDKTFKKEHAFFKKHLPDTITNHCTNRFVDYLPESFLSILTDESLPGMVDLQITPIVPEMIFMQETTNNITNFNNPLILQNTEGILSFNLDDLILKFGRDAFGIYLPFHSYEECWGIYLFKELIENRAIFLHSLFHDLISLDKLLQLYYFAVYRHELFHYQVERFATKLELITKSQIYQPSQTLFQEVRDSEDWLEESLAESAVLSSTLVVKRTALKSKLIKIIYERDLQDMPNGYRHYKCLKYGGPVAAHRRFASQIIEKKLKPKVEVTDLVSIKSEFIALDKNVPAFLVTGFDKLSPLRNRYNLNN